MRAQFLSIPQLCTVNIKCLVQSTFLWFMTYMYAPARPQLMRPLHVFLVLVPPFICIPCTTQVQVVRRTDWRNGCNLGFCALKYPFSLEECAKSVFSVQKGSQLGETQRHKVRQIYRTASQVNLLSASTGSCRSFSCRQR